MCKYSKVYAALLASGAMFQTFSASAAGNGACTYETTINTSKVLTNCNISLKPTDNLNIANATLTINNSTVQVPNAGHYIATGLLGFVHSSTVNIDRSKFNLDSFGTIYTAVENTTFNINNSSFSAISDGFVLTNSTLNIHNNSTLNFSGSDSINAIKLEANSTANLTDTAFTITGANAHGLRVENNSTANLTNTTLNFSNQNSNSTGLRVSDNSTANLNNVTLNLTGNHSSALVLSNRSKVELKNSTLHLSGNNGTGAALSGSNATVSNITVTLNGRDSKGLILNSSTADVNNSRFNVNKKDSAAITLTNKSKVNIADSIFVIGKDLCRAEALHLTNSSGKITNSTLTSGSYAPVINLNRSTLDIERTHLTVTNSYAEGTALQATGMGTINITDTNIKADYFLNAALGPVTLKLNNSKVDSDTLVTSKLSKVDLTANNSTLKGRTVLSNLTVLNVTLNDSQWMLKGNNASSKKNNAHSVNHLKLNNGSVTLLPNGNKFQTFTISGDLSGTGTFALNTDLANQKSDKIVVKGKDSGDFKLAIKDSGNEPKDKDGRVTLVETQQGMAKFSLKDRDYVDAGAYRYRLIKDGKNWLLSNRQGEQSVPPVQPQPQPKPQPMPNPPVQPQPQPKPQPMPNPPVQPQPQPKPQPMPNPPVQPQPQPKPQPPVRPQLMLSEKTNALVSLRQAQLLQIEQGLAGIHQRLGELKQGESGNVWVRNVNQRTELDALNTARNSRSSGFTQDYHGVQLGADKLITSNVRIGAFIGTANADIDFNGAYGSGKVKSRQAGLYATLLTDNGFYSDLVYTYDRLNAESGSTGKQSFSAHSVSNEIGKIYRFANNWTVTPQLQAAFSRFSGNSNVERLNSVYARAGLRIAKSFELADWTLQPYAEVNGVTSKNSSGQVKVNQYAFDVASAKGRLETALGANIAIGNHRFGIEGKTTHGNNLKQPFVAQAVYRYQW